MNRRTFSTLVIGILGSLGFVKKSASKNNPNGLPVLKFAHSKPHNWKRMQNHLEILNNVPKGTTINRIGCFVGVNDDYYVTQTLCWVNKEDCFSWGTQVHWGECILTESFTAYKKNEDTAFTLGYYVVPAERSQTTEFSCYATEMFHCKKTDKRAESMAWWKNGQRT